MESFLDFRLWILVVVVSGWGTATALAFYTAGSKPFKPFELNSKYVEFVD